MTRGFIPLLALVLAGGMAALSWATDGFRVVTSDGARQLAVERRPLPLPDIRLIDQDGHPFSFADYRGKTLLVDLIYTRCPTICGVLGENFRQVLEHSGANKAGRNFDLLSISFDPAHDDLQALKLYGERYGAVAPRWRIAVPSDRRGLDTLLRSFGAVVIPDGNGGFVHSSDVYLVDSAGRLARIFDADAPWSLSGAAIHEAAR